MTDYKTLLARCDQDIRAGRIGKAAKLLHQLNTAQVGREWKLPLAKMCRRAGQIGVGLRLLTPVVLSQAHKLLGTATDEEMAEYAVLLQRHGSVGEALRLLERIPADKVPEALLYRAFCHFNSWRYPTAIPLLERYLSSIEQDYPRLVGHVNLAAALAMCRMHDRALATLAKALEEARRWEHRRLEANCLELRAQVFIQMEMFAKAREDLDLGVKLLDSASVHDTMFLSKWSAIIDAQRSESIAPLERMRGEASSRRLWETVREADLYILKVKFDPELHEKLVFGTPFEAYRERVANETGVHSLAQHIVIGDSNAPCLDVSSGEFTGGIDLKPGSKNHQLIEILSRDLYRPAKVGGLFSGLFPGEYFDIFSSPDRVHQILRRTRAWLKKSKTPLEIEEWQGFYSLKIGKGVALKLPLRRQQASWFEVHLQKLHSAFRAGEILPADVIRGELEFTEAEYKRFIKWALEQKKFQRIGGGRSTSYRLLGLELAVALHG
jgi:tetratricopeptide (TPR) repeat protein